MMKQIVFVLIGFLILSGTVTAQNKAVIYADEVSFDFGTIAEEAGLATHIFAVKNTGNTPLVITRVTVSCGCTTPGWTKAPIAPGKTGEVSITYDPKGRPGPFSKTASVYSNGKEGPYTLAVRGNVTPKKLKPVISYPYTIGELKMHTKNVLYSGIRPNETLGEKIMIKNDSKLPVSIHIGKYPSYFTINAQPQTLGPGETGEITVLLDAHNVKKLGRITTHIPLTVASEKTKGEEGTFKVSANIIDDFSKLSVSDKEHAPAIVLKSDLVDFGTLNSKSGRVSQTLHITNTGKSELIIRSISSDDARIDISGGRKEIKPGASTSFKVTIRPKDVKTNLEAIINIVCNDPNNPVRLIKVTAK